jgi:tRNA-Thr(GGU) m(6)t(6)A37 methyltransferase TsaA
LLDTDPASVGPDAGLVFVGRVHSDWKSGPGAPRNLTEARQRHGTGQPAKAAWIEIEAPYRPCLAGLAAYSHVIVLGWLAKARRDLARIHPEHVAEPRGVFALRSPVRPNPVSLSVVRLLGVDEVAGRIDLDAIDLFDGTPVVDIKPYRPGVDAVPEAVVP